MYYQFFKLSLLLILCSLKLEAVTVGLLPEGTQCVCVGERVIYNCGVFGGSSTLWRGSAFDCPQDGSVITLRHTQFGSNQAFGICSNGDIIGRGLEAVNNCYTSQLNVTVRENFNNKSVQCVLNSRDGTRTIGESVLNVVSATNLYPPPANIYLADAQPGTLVFNWTSNCSILKYDITSDCGTCPPLTNTTTVTCSDLQLTTNVALCNFRVSSVACDLVGNPSPPFVVMLKVPNIPQVQIVPIYSKFNDSQVLKTLYIVTTMNQTEDYFNISDGISGSPTSYTAHVSTSISSTSFDSTVGWSSCEEGSGCTVELPSSYCSQSAIITVTISAANKLGSGPHSNPFMIECMNNFVQVVHKETTSGSTISCVFLNPSDASEKTCCIVLRSCDQKEIDDDQTEYCSKTSNYDIQLEASRRSDETYCYTVTATNATYTTKVEGTIVFSDIDSARNMNTAAIAIGIVIACICIMIVVTVVLFVTIMTVRRKGMKQPFNSTKIESAMQVSEKIPLQAQSDSLKKYLKDISPSDERIVHRQHEVEQDCEMREFITVIQKLDVEFRRGHTYYEFTNKIENILEGKKVFLQDKNSKKWFSLFKSEDIAAKDRELYYGEGIISQNSFGEDYKVFIQSFGSGARHLPRGSSILYDHEDQVEFGVLPLVPVCSEYFAHKVIDSKEECTVKQFCRANELNTAAFNIFLHPPEEMSNQSPHDVILMDKVSKKLFTGPLARQMLDKDKPEHEKQKWKVFVLLDKKKHKRHHLRTISLKLKKGSEVLYQDSSCWNGKYTLLIVDDDGDCMRLSTFIEKKLRCQYEDGKAFYEMSEMEDLLYCKKVLRPEQELIDNESDQQVELQTKSLIEYFYAIEGAPSKEIKRETLSHRTNFIQCTSQGSRCLKKGARLLYLTEYVRPTHRLPKLKMNMKTIKN